MALRATFTIEDVRHQLELAHKLFEKTVIARLQYLGEECTNLARDKGSYIDRTGALRSSTGYMVVVDGVVLKRGGFDEVKGTETTTIKGTEIGLELATRLAFEIEGDYVLIVVAGMNYASSVESKGYDVLTSSEMYAKSEVPKILQKLSDQLKNRKLLYSKYTRKKK
jgi:hypothetical protein